MAGERTLVKYVRTDGAGKILGTGVAASQDLDALPDRYSVPLDTDLDAVSHRTHEVVAGELVARETPLDPPTRNPERPLGRIQKLEARIAALEDELARRP